MVEKKENCWAEQMAALKGYQKAESWDDRTAAHWETHWVERRGNQRAAVKDY